MADAAEVQRLEDELAEIRAAISAVRKHGQGHGMVGRSLNRADLEALERSESRVERKLANARRGGRLPMHRMIPRG